MRWLVALLLLAPSVAFAQGIPNGGPILPGQAWTVPQWNNAWQSKVDGSNGVCNTCTLLNPTITGLILNSYSTTGDASIGGNFSVTGAATLHGGSLLGTFSGTPTLSGLWTFSGGLSGTLTGHASLDLPLAGGTLSGAVHMGANTLDGSAVAFTGGTVNGVAIGGTTRAAGAFTTLGANGAATLAGGTASGNWTFSNAGQALKVNDTALFGNGAANTLAVSGGSSGARITTGGSANTGPFVIALNTTLTGSSAQLLRINGTDGSGASTPIIDINGSLNSSTNFYNSLQIVNGAGFPAQSALQFVQTLNGTPSSGQVPIVFRVTDNLAASGLGGSGVMSIDDNLSSSSVTGIRNALSSRVAVSAPTGNTTGLGGAYQAAILQAYASVNDNGVNDANWGTALGGKGALWSFNTVAHLTGTATYYASLNGGEIDVQADAGTSMNIKDGLAIVQIAGDVAQGAWEDQALVFGRSDPQTSGRGWRDGMVFGRPTGYFPMDPLGRMITAGPVSGGTMLAATGMDFSLVTFSKNFLNSRNFAVDGSGTIKQGSGIISYTGSAMSIDVNYLHGLAEGTVITGGTIVSGGTGAFLVGQVLTDACNGFYTVNAVSGGVITSLTVTRQSFCPVGTSATVTLSQYSWGVGTGTVQITQTWTTDSTLSLQPSGGLLTIGGARADKQTVVASLPTCNSGAKGYAYVVTDSNTTTFNATLAGGGSNVVGALCNGTNWTVH